MKKILFILLSIAFLFPYHLFAAEVSFDTTSQDIKVNQLFKVGVFINTDEESINAIEGKIIFPQDLLEIKKINDGNSIINFWIEKPKSATGGQIAFSGIVPGGYKDSRGLIFSITFLAKKEGGGAIEFSGVKALRNDGQGTEAPLTISNFNFTVRETAKSTGQMPTAKEDRDLPEDFAPQIAADPAIFEGKWFLVFSTQDKGSGIDRYDIQENRKAKIKDKKWVIGESPYLLKDQGLKSYIYVKVIDKSGNERITMLLPQKPLLWYENHKNWLIIILGLVIVYAVI